jgi:DNA-binding GntR family transcriptional regulator
MVNEEYPHKQLHEKVSVRLRQAILDGEFKPGEWIRQKKIADEMGVSQIPVREALKELVAEGYVEHIPYRGVRVVKYSVEDVADIYAQRACLESRAAREAALKVTEKDLLKLEEMLTFMEEHEEPEHIKVYRDYNRNFHQTIYRLSQREFLVRTLDQMWNTFPTMLINNFSPTFEKPIDSRYFVDSIEHRAIIQALQDQDPFAAEEAVLQHITNAGNALVDQLTPETERR